MAIVEPSVLANSIMAKLYNVLTNGDDVAPPSDDNFFSWNTPGTPIEPADLEFLTQGLTGIVKKEAVAVIADANGIRQDPAAAAANPLTPEQLNALRAQDTMRLYMQAENLARLLDFVPDVAAMNNQQFARMAVRNDDGSLSDVYRYTLRMSQVMQTELPADITAKIEKFRGLMNTVVKKKDLITDEETETTVPSALTLAYNEKLEKYRNAALDYNNKRIDALTANDPRAVHDWAINANIYRDRVRAAMDDWVNSGYKLDYEGMSAFITQVQQRDMALLKREYLDDLEKARLTSPVSGSDFFFTSLVPGNFATSTGWTRFGFTAGDYESHRNGAVSSSSWSTRAGGGFLGIFGGSAAAGGAEGRQEYHGTFESSHTSMSFEIAEIPIARPWFRPAFLSSRSWRFDQNNPTVKGNVLSDAGSPPKGMMPGYATSAIFVRKLSLSFGESSGFSDFVATQKSNYAGGGGGLSFGCFFLGGSYSQRSASGTSQRDWGYKYENNTMNVDGMQLIGYRCHVLPKSPDPNPAIPANAWI